MIRWLHPEVSDNTLQFDSMRCRYQLTFGLDEVLSASLLPDDVRTGARRHELNLHRRADALFELENPIAGFRELLVEAKSGAQGPDAALFQLMLYRDVLARRLGRLPLSWAITEAEPSVSSKAFDGPWAFSSANGIELLLATTRPSGSPEAASL
jgi:hypothetical protein